MEHLKPFNFIEFCVDHGFSKFDSNNLIKKVGPKSVVHIILEKGKYKLMFGVEHYFSRVIPIDFESAEKQFQKMENSEGFNLL
jgi:hypothetical protein